MKKILIFFGLVASIFVSSHSQAEFSFPALNGAMATAIALQDLQISSNAIPTQQRVLLLSSSSLSDVYKVTLEYPIAGKINMLMKGPPGFLSRQNVQAMMIVSGFFTGEQSVHLLGNFPDKVVIGFEYPYGIADFQIDPGTILQFMRKTPGQIALGLRWLSFQSWMRPKGLSVMGVSLGGIFLPSALHLSQYLNIDLDLTVFVGTGTELPAILSENLKSYVGEPLLEPMVAALMAPTLLMNPTLHLPYLKGRSLVIQTDGDTVIPLRSKAALMSLLKGPKTQVVLAGPHINADQSDLIKQIQKVVIEHLN